MSQGEHGNSVTKPRDMPMKLKKRNSIENKDEATAVGRHRILRQQTCGAAELNCCGHNVENNFLIVPFQKYSNVGSARPATGFDRPNTRFR